MLEEDAATMNAEIAAQGSRIFALEVRKTLSTKLIDAIAEIERRRALLAEARA